LLIFLKKVLGFFFLEGKITIFIFLLPAVLKRSNRVCRSHRDFCYFWSKIPNHLIPKKITLEYR
jgi:hypothetical protein